MAKSGLEKAIERQQKEAKRLAQREELRQTASTIVSGQPVIGGMRMMDNAAEEIQEIILSIYDGNCGRRVQGTFDAIPNAYDFSLRLEFEKLRMYGMIVSQCIYLDGAWEVILTPQGLTYFDDKKAALEKEDKVQRATVNIGSITASGGNIFLGDVTNSSFSIDNSISDMEQEISEKGGDDAEELKAILGEVRELIENIDSSRHIPKNKGLFQRISGHLDKHGWLSCWTAWNGCNDFAQRVKKGTDCKTVGPLFVL